MWEFCDRFCYMTTVEEITIPKPKGGRGKVEWPYMRQILSSTIQIHWGSCSAVIGRPSKVS